MKKKSPFNAYNTIYRVGLEITPTLPLRIGAKKDEVSIIEPDLPIIRNSSDLPIIPGSSLKGFFRAQIYRLFRGLIKNRNAVNRLVDRLFGDSNTHASRLHFCDLALSSPPNATIERMHIRINPETGGTVRSALFMAEAVKEGTVFRNGLVTARNIPLQFLGVFHSVKKLCDLQIARLGGFKSRGYGAVRMDFPFIEIILPAVTENSLDDGVEIQSTLGIMGATKLIRENASKVVAEFSGKKLHLAVSFEDQPSFFGTKISMRDPHNFIESMAKALGSSLRKKDESD